MSHRQLIHQPSAHKFSARTRVGRALLVSCCSIPLLFTGCAAESTDAGQTQADTAPGFEEMTGESELTGSSGSSEPVSGGTATATIDGVDFTFDLAFCAIGDEDTLAHGPGASNEGEDAYLDIDFQSLDDTWHGEVRIDLGISEQFDSSDNFYVFTTYRDDGDKLISNIAATATFSATGTYWTNGEQPGVDGSIEIDCS